MFNEALNLPTIRLKIFVDHKSRLRDAIAELSGVPTRRKAIRNRVAWCCFVAADLADAKLDGREINGHPFCDVDFYRVELREAYPDGPTTCLSDQRVGMVTLLNG